MNDRPSQPRTCGLLWPGLVVAALAVYGYLAYRPPLESARPKGAAERMPNHPAPPGFTSLHGRQWEDPLGVVYQRGDPPSQPSTIFDAFIDPIREAKRQKKLDSIQYVFDAVLEKARKELRAADDGSTPWLHCLPVLLPGGPYSDDREQRMRIRYAVLAALGRAGYKLSYPNRMSYVDLSVAVEFPEVGAAKDVTLRVPLKLFGRDDIAGIHTVAIPNILVCWINESQLGGRPLAVIAQVLEQLFGLNNGSDAERRKKIRLSILGPTGSDALLAIAKEHSNWSEYPDGQAHEAGYFSSIYHHPTIFSPRATIPPFVLREPDEDGPYRWMQDLMQADGSQGSGLKLVRCIGTDRHLFRALQKELRLRGAWPEDDDSAKHVVIITERDTIYARAVERIVAGLGPNHHGDDHHNSAEHVHIIQFFRGLDGQVPGGGETAAEKRLKPDEASEYDTEKFEEARPVGRSQYDYLRRLEQRLLHLQRDVAAGHHRLRAGRITAVGVVGTDVFDKLLVLRALRPHFPRAVFFTTDLSAYFSHESELRHTRNLVVASHYGLELNHGLQKDVPPFRDSYQTAVFFGTLLALEDRDHRRGPVIDHLNWLIDHGHVNGLGDMIDKWPKVASDPWKVTPQTNAHGEPPDADADHDPSDHLHPLIFEIGRHGAYQLTNPGGLSAALHPHSPRDNPWFLHFEAWFFGILAVLGLALFAAGGSTFVSDRLTRLGSSLKRLLRPAEVRPGDITVVLCLIAAVVLGYMIGADHLREDGEPFLPAEGISVWPAAVIQVFVLLLAAVWLLRAAGDLDRNRDSLVRDHLPDEEAGFIAETSQLKSRELGRRVPGAGAAMVALIWRRPELWVLPDWPRKELPDWLRKELSDWLPEDQERESAVRLCREYFILGHRRLRWSRVAAMTGFFVVLAVSVFFLIGWPQISYRGGLSQFVGIFALLSSSLALAVLSFFVFDATRLARRFIAALAKQTRWPHLEEGGDAYLHRGGKYPEPLARCVLAVRIIADRSADVLRLIKYPLIAAGLLALSCFPQFDRVIVSWPLVALLTVVVAGAAASTIRLHYEAAKVRGQIVRELQDELAKATLTATEKQRKTHAEAIDEIRGERRGAFSHWTDDPVLRWLAIPAGGLGGLAIVAEYLLKV